VDRSWLSSRTPAARPSPRGRAIIGDRLPRSPQPVEGLTLVIARAARVQGVLGPVDEPTARFGQRDLDLKSRATLRRPGLPGPRFGTGAVAQRERSSADPQGGIKRVSDSPTIPRHYSGARLLQQSSPEPTEGVCSGPIKTPGYREFRGVHPPTPFGGAWPFGAGGAWRRRPAAYSVTTGVYATRQ
jgi:hypothetical protein